MVKYNNQKNLIPVGMENYREKPDVSFEDLRTQVKQWQRSSKYSFYFHEHAELTHIWIQTIAPNIIALFKLCFIVFILFNLMKMPNKIQSSIIMFRFLSVSPLISKGWCQIFFFFFFSIDLVSKTIIHLSKY